MLNLIYGSPGSGKTYLSDTLVLKALKDGKKAVLLVPEQEAVDTESRIYDRAISEDVSLERLSVVSFRRLANLAFRKHGGIAYSSIGNGGKLLLLWRIIEELEPALTVYKNNRDRSLIELMLSVCTEFKRYCVTPSALSKAIDAIADVRFKTKLNEIALIYTSYCARTSEKNTDPSDDVNRLAEIYRTAPIDKNELFFVDSFNGFTVPELHVLEHLIKNCEVTVTVNKPLQNGMIGFQTVEKTEKQLKELALKSKAKINTVAVLNDVCTHAGSEFTLIKNKLFDFAYSSDPEFSSENITFAVCKDRFSEAEFIASRILDLVRSGAKYRDIAIVTRGIEKYEGILDAVFEQHSIPLFLTSRYKLNSTPLYKTVNTALSVISDGFETEDVMTLLKCGLLDISTVEADAIESYVTLWNINGKRWYDENEWFMNPSGFTDVTDENTTDKLALINTTRNKIIEPLLNFKDRLRGANGKNAAKAIYEYIKESGIYKYFSNSKDPEDITVYNTFTDLLDTLVTIIGDIPVNASVISSLLYLIAKNTDYGVIPSSLDRVTAGDASIIRCNGIKHVFLADCENGSFPAAVSDDSFFSDSEKKILNNYDIELSPNIQEKNDLESFYFLRSASGATETLTATICEKGGKKYPSVGLQRLHALFPNNKTFVYPDDFSINEMITDSKSAQELIASLKGTDLYERIKSALDELKITYKTDETPISDSNVTVSAETADLLFGKQISMTSSRFDSYVKCPFAYYCSNVLKIREKKTNYFEASDKGTYIHRILEKAVKTIYDDKKGNPITDEMVLEAVDKALNEVLIGILGTSKSSAGTRFEAMILRLRNVILSLTFNIVEEFKDSDFIPRYFEFKIGNDGLEPLTVKDGKGLTVRVYGTIDRVDTYKRGDDVYIRVVDYKTGSKEHSIENIKYGLDTQMLLYLFTLLNTDNDKFLKEIGVENDGSLLPAGVLYQPARFVPERTELPKDSTKEIALNAFKRTGVIINNSELLNAMEHGIKGEYLPVTQDKNGLKATSKLKLVSNEQLDDIKNEVVNAIIDIGTRMKDGDASASPLSVADPCKYCTHYPICRSRQKN